jgi:hypothetical protein
MFYHRLFCAADRRTEFLADGSLNERTSCGEADSV